MTDYYEYKKYNQKAFLLPILGYFSYALGHYRPC